MSRKVADISECSEVNLIGSTVCCNGLQFHPFSSVLTGPIRRYLMSKFTVVKIWTFVFSGSDISQHAQGPPPPPPFSIPGDICWTFFFEKLQQIPNGADSRFKHRPHHGAENFGNASSRGQSKNRFHERC